MLKFICYPKCSTCMKAQKWLDENSVAYETQNIKEENPTKDELASYLKKYGRPASKMFNTNGLLYRSMGLKDKIGAMSEDEILTLLATDGMLVKRPILVGDGFALFGFREAEWAEKLNIDPGQK